MSRFPDYPSWLVVEVAAGFGAASLAGKILSDLGCRVARLETGLCNLDDDADSSEAELLELISRSKDSVRLDWSRGAVREVLDAVLAKAAILVVDGDGFRRIERFWDRDELSARFPDLTVCVCTPFGLEGPLSGWTGGEALVQAASGIMSITGHPGSGPTCIAGAPLTHAAAMFAVSSAVADDLRKRSGARGAQLDVAVYDAAIAFQSASLPAYFLSGIPPRGIGNRHSMSVPWNSFPCADGWVIICAGNHANWVRLCESIGRPDMVTDPRYATQDDRIAHVDEIEAAIVAWTQGRSVAAVEAELERNSIAGGSIMPLTAVIDHPQFRTRNLLDMASGGAMTGGVFHFQQEPLEMSQGHWRSGAGTQPVLLGLAGRTTYERWLAEGLIAEEEAEAVDEPA